MEGWSLDLETSLSALGLIAAPLIKKNNIPAISIVTVSSTGDITTQAEGITNNGDPQKVTDQTIFEAASLSKPVFAYVVLKMAERGEIDLDTPLIEILEKKFGKEDPRAQFGPDSPAIREHDNYRKLTARMLLSHQAGLPNEFIHPKYEFEANAGKRFDYSGEAYRFLMEVIDKISSPKSVADLAQEEFKKIGMEHSSFIRPNTANIAVGHYEDGKTDERQHFFGVHPAGSLHTTAEDYGKFLSACTSDDYVSREMFSPCVAELSGKDTKGKGVPEGILCQIAWGFGIGLQRNIDGSMTAFHWGDGSGTCRNFAAINLSTNQAVACFTNSANGPLVFRQICEPVVGDLSIVSQWLTIREGLPKPNLPDIDYQMGIVTFDQGDTGWRRFLYSDSQPTPEQYRQAGNSIKRYFEENKHRGVSSEQLPIWEFSLNFHAFQMYANCNDLEMMQKFINQAAVQFKAMSVEDIEKLKKVCGPTVKPYLEATMIFLSNSDNKQQLLEQKLDEILKAPHSDYFDSWVPTYAPQDVTIPKAFVTQYQSSKQERQKQESTQAIQEEIRHDKVDKRKFDQ